MVDRGVDSRLSALERWRDAVDTERGTIMADVSRVETLVGTVKDEVHRVHDRLDTIFEKLEERPSHAELKEVERGLESVRAKTNKPRGSEFELSGPQKWKMRLSGVSGVTIVLVLLLVVLLVGFIVALFFLLKK
jgi:hypothetical protein